MVEEKELVTLFKIKKLDDEYESIIPFAVVDGIYNEENHTFMTPDGVVYTHITETQYPAFGYAKRTTVEIDPTIEEGKFGSLDFEIERKFNTDNIYKYLRFINDPKKIYVKGNYSDGINLLSDEDTKKYSESKNAQIEEQAMDEGYLGIEQTPKEICELVKKTIKGQDEAIKKIVTCLWTTVNGRNLSKPITKKQMIIIGPTGVGKTAIFKKLQKILDIPVVIFSVPGLSQAGYVGRSTDEILKQVYYETMQNVDVAQKAIVILDEYDKIAYNGADKSGDISTVGVQNELLKMIEGYNRVVEINNGEDAFEIDTSNMIFIASGAFQELFDDEEKSKMGFYNQESKKKIKKEITADDLVGYGIKRESIGRLPIIVQLNELTKEIYKEIILESDESEFLAHIDFLESLGVKVNNLDEVIELIIDDAIQKNIGARGLTSTISKIFLNIIYEVANNEGKYNEVILGKNIIDNQYDFELIEAKTKTRIRFKKED